MPEKPRISVHEYIDARLDEQDEAVIKRMDEQDYKIELRHIENRIELRELRGWFLMLSAPGWAALIERYTNQDVTAAASFVVVLLGFVVIFFYRTRKPIKLPKSPESR